MILLLVLLFFFRQKPILKKIGVPIPSMYLGEKKSYTLPGGGDGKCSIGVLSLDFVYTAGLCVNNVGCEKKHIYIYLMLYI